jgi:hypothetical protein
MHLIALGLPVLQIGDGSDSLSGCHRFEFDAATPTPFRGFPQASAGLMPQVGLTFAAHPLDI